MTSEPSDLRIRPVTRGELEIMVEWAAQEGWNPGLRDADCFHAADPEGFLMAFLAGEPVASISVVRYGEGFGFLGFYIVRPDMRGRGYGYRLWQAGMARLGGRIVGLDGVVAQQDNYRRSGFALAHRNVRYGGCVQVEPPRDARLTPIGAELRDAVTAYDRAFFPAPRPDFLRCWLEPGVRRALAVVEDGSIRGYGVVRACRTGFKIGPLFADGEEIADLLFRGLAAAAQDAPVFLDPPVPNAEACALAARYGLAPVFETARMYRGPAPDLPLPRIYGITTFELG
jgi:GNAT superfamily N-acetyltransferase